MVGMEWQGDGHGVEARDVLRSHWSRRLNSSSAVGPPVLCVAATGFDDDRSQNDWQQKKRKVKLIPGSPFAAKSKAVVKSHIWMAPLNTKGIEASKRNWNSVFVWSPKLEFYKFLIPPTYLECPVKMNRLGREPNRLDPSHSWTQKLVMFVPSTDSIVQILKRSQLNSNDSRISFCKGLHMLMTYRFPFEANRT